MNKPWILPIIVFSQFCCTSLWFAGNGVMDDLILEFGLNSSALGHLTSAVQFGFIIGTLIFALLTIADRFSPSKVFLISAFLGSLCNLGTIWEGNSFTSLMVFRALTGFFLAGIYPVGMKIASDYYQKGLGKSLGYLVGALVVGTAFPHLAKDISGPLEWQSVLKLTSAIALGGGLLMALLVPDGPFRKPGQALDLSTSFKVFRDKNFRSAAFGYFGHMWELYAFWAFIPLMLTTYTELHTGTAFNIPLTSFLVIGTGGLACAFGGYLSMSYHPGKIAASVLAASAMCCLVSPIMFIQKNEYALFAFLIFWGLVVTADSPLFSTLVAKNAPADSRGTALTIVNCIGFSITIISLQVMGIAWNFIDPKIIYMILAAGPILGLWGFFSGSTEYFKNRS